MRRIQKELTQYCYEVLGAMNGSPAYKRQIWNTLKCDIELYLSENPDATIEEIRQHFGEPAKYASEATAAMGEKELSRKLRFGKKVFTTVVAGILVALVMWGICIAYSMYQVRLIGDGYTVSEYVDVGMEE